MKTRTLLVDSNFLIKRSQFGVKNTFTSKFGDISILYGFMIKTRELIKTFKSNRTIFFFDGQNGGSDRHKLLNDYKSTRKNKSWYNKIELSEAEILREQEKEFSLLKNKVRIQQYAEDLYIRQIEVDTIESDDLIAAYCIKHHKLKNITIYTNDRDYSTLLDT